MLCDGFRKAAGGGDHGQTTIPGVFCRFPNGHAKALKEDPWPQLLALLGQSGERIMIDMLLDSCIFMSLTAGFGNYYQLSGECPFTRVQRLAADCLMTGPPLYDVELNRDAPAIRATDTPRCRKPSDITLVRSRIFYAKPTLTARGLVQAGFKHIRMIVTTLFPSLAPC